MKATDETKKLAKEAGIKSYWLKSEETLQEELGNEEVVTKTVDSAETIIEEVVVIEAEELVLPTDVSKKLMIFSIKCVGNKSPYYKYKDLL